MSSSWWTPTRQAASTAARWRGHWTAPPRACACSIFTPIAATAATWPTGLPLAIRLARGLSRSLAKRRCGRHQDTDESAEGKGGDDDERLITELAALGRLAYAKRRADAAKRLGIAVTALDAIVAEARGEEADQQQPEHWHVEPWSEPVATGDLLEALSATYAQHVILPEHGALAMALWTLHAWVHRRGLLLALHDVCQPRAALREKHGDVADRLDRSAHGACLQSSRPPRSFALSRPCTRCLLIDEAETYESEEARGDPEQRPQPRYGVRHPLRRRGQRSRSVSRHGRRRRSPALDGSLRRCGIAPSSCR